MSTSRPASRDELISYAKRQLGEPGIEVKLYQDKEEDDLELSLQLYQEYHVDGVERI